SLGHLIGKIFHMSEKDQTIITMCGMSAVFTALFGTPLTATLFSMEVVSVGVFYYAALIPCLVASLISQALAWALGFTPLFYTVKIPAMEFLSFGRVAVLACLGALVSIVFCVLLRHGGRFFAKVIPNPWLRIFFGGIAIVLLTLALGTYDYNGLGLPVIGRALAGEAVPTAFLWKILFTVITIGVGFKGGEIVPTLFIGAVFGCCVGQWLGLPADFGAAIGLTSLFCAVVNCPISSIILSVELFGGSGLLFFALASAVSFMLSGKYSLYHEQKIVYSKIAAKFIDASTH
ncbi:MAG: chloride channel protein, partial [Bacillota bacterium]|nr:chloride channel protein [Bacillota bacterium]